MSGKVAYPKGLLRENRYTVIGNHKLFLPGKAQTGEVVKAVVEGVRKERLFGVTVGIVPTETWLNYARNIIDSIPTIEQGNVLLLAQTVSKASEGAYTTGTSPVAVKEAGAVGTLVNHHEHRSQFGGLTPDLNLRLMAAIEAGLDVIVCIGEPKQHRGISVREIYETQLIHAFQGMPEDKVRGRVLLALEPGHLIGEELSVLPVREIQEGVKTMYEIIEEKLPQFAGLPFIYGGGISADNVAGLIHHFRGDKRFVGALPGTASKEAPEFLNVIRNVHNIVVPEEERKVFVDMAIPIAPGVEPAAPVIEEVPKVVAPAPIVFKPREFKRILSVDEIGAKMGDRPIRVGIMGFGEVGRAIVEAAAALGHPVDIVWAVNRDLSILDAEGRALKLEFLPGNTIFSARDGELGREFSIKGKGLRPQRYSYLNISTDDVTPAASHFADQADMVVIAASPLMNDKSTIMPFIEHGAKVVILTSTSSVDDITLTPGVNDDLFTPGVHKIVALGSCTGNAATTVAAAIGSLYGEEAINGALFVTPHSITPSQQLTVRGMDAKAEGTFGNIILTSTGLSKLFSKPGFFPAAAKANDALSYRVPVEYVSSLATYLMIRGAKPGQENDLANHLKSEAQSARFNGMLLALDRIRGTRYARNGFWMVETYGDSIKVLPNPESEEAGIVRVGASFGNVPGYAGNAVRAALLFGYRLREAGLLG